MVRDQKKVSLVFGFAVAAVVLTLIVGFNWGGWVTGGTAQAMANDAVVQRLAPICVAQFDQDPGNQQKLSELKAKRSYQRDDYVIEQGWATLPGDQKPDSKVADACAKLLMRIDQ
ncbi:MAG: hypothetical protein P8186_27065 [Anaerolineae bacterium]